MNINDYRSISILSAFSKVFELIMYEWFFTFFYEKNEFYWNPFGFCSRPSTINALVEVTKQFRQRSTDTFTCILVEFRKAFDSIIREIFQTKLEKCGVKRNCLSCSLNQTDWNDVSVLE